MRPALPSALPYVNDLDVGEHISKRRHPNCRIFAFPSSTGDIPFLVFSPRIKKPRLKGDFSPVHAPALPNRGRTLHLSRKCERELRFVCQSKRCSADLGPSLVDKTDTSRVRAVGESEMTLRYTPRQRVGDGCPLCVGPSEPLRRATSRTH